MQWGGEAARAVCVRRACGLHGLRGVLPEMELLYR